MARLTVPNSLVDIEPTPIISNVSFNIGAYRRRYRKLESHKEKVLERLNKANFHFLYPHVQPVFVTDVLKLKDKEITPRQYGALIKKICLAEELGVHPDEIIIYNIWGAV
ncbi:hypothetical protein MTAT_04460 [Moorella thermoacetica]|uniref:Uncharacterized protein n=1 Tax=Neomoorella thermoacetica TaxID=1525 RepID=A0AAC9HJE6_NEOTH|nr:hypothetical protein [Moorella thermoacetica]AOQ24755.1 hypothetical protein Maut_02327 [Moorella thermoacetica]TYL15707.1 hypothetical protein MTAT_04460 [Moorella thermoacetica]